MNKTNPYKSLKKHLVNNQETNQRKYITFLGFIKITKRKHTKKTWAKKNRHNFVTLKNYNVADLVSVGNYSYGELEVLASSDLPCKLEIGHFCSIGSNVTFILASEHPLNSLSTYPFKVKFLGYNLESGTKGNIIIKDDVWIGANATILSGVTIGQGAVIAAGSIVTKDVPPYAIVGGNPAKIIKYRFEPNIVEQLLKLDYSKLTEEKIIRIINETTKVIPNPKT